jgi:hypothetical protein
MSPGWLLAEILALLVLTSVAVPTSAAVPPSAAVPAGAAAARAATGATQPAPVTVGPVVITVPQGFAAAQTQKAKRTLITAWTKSVKDGSSKTFLQLTVVELGKPAAPEEAEKILRRELAIIGRRRANYSSSPLAHIQLAGAPAVRATWNGNIGGYPVMGVVYSVIVKDRYVVKFLAQDLGTTPTDGLFEAMKAIESIGMS